MTCAIPSESASRISRPRRRVRSRWWLAGLLVGCLLPALGQAEALRLAERLTQICLMAPEAIRAESRRVARHRATRRLPRRHVRPRSGPTPACRPARGLPCADDDVLSRRGPPPRAAVPA